MIVPLHAAGIDRGAGIWLRDRARLAGCILVALGEPWAVIMMLVGVGLAIAAARAPSQLQRSALDIYLDAGAWITIGAR